MYFTILYHTVRSWTIQVLFCWRGYQGAGNHDYRVERSNVESCLLVDESSVFYHKVLYIMTFGILRTCKWFICLIREPCSWCWERDCWTCDWFWCGNCWTRSGTCWTCLGRWFQETGILQYANGQFDNVSLQVMLLRCWPLLVYTFLFQQEEETRFGGFWGSCEEEEVEEDW